MLDLRPICENCGTPLPPDALDARICTFECTFCAACAEGPLAGVCPNCSGELLTRPIRPSALVDAAATPEPVRQVVDVAAHARRLAERTPGPDHPGVVLRRYADAWRRGDLDELIGCYSDAFTIHYFGSSRFAGTHQGRDAALEVMAEVSTLAPRELVGIDDVAVSDTGGVLVVTERLRRDDEVIEVVRVLRYLVADGRLDECWLHETDQAAVDHLWR